MRLSTLPILRRLPVTLVAGGSAPCASQEHCEHGWKKECLFILAQVLGIDEVPVAYPVGVLPAELVRRFVGFVPGRFDLHGAEFAAFRGRESTS